MRSYPRVRGNGAASVTPASSSRPLLTQYTGRNWLNAKIVESCEGVLCRPARSSADVCQRGTVRQHMGGGNTPGGVSPHPRGARLALRLVRQGDGLHYPVGQPLFGDSLPFLLPSVEDKELLGASDAPGAGHVYAQCSYGTQGHLRVRGQYLQVPHLIAEGRGGNLGHVSRPGSQDNVRVDRPEHKALLAYRKGSRGGWHRRRCILRHPHRTPWVPNGTGQRCMGRNVVPELYSLGYWQNGSWARVRRQVPWT